MREMLDALPIRGKVWILSLSTKTLSHLYHPALERFLILAQEADEIQHGSRPMVGRYLLLSQQAAYANMQLGCTPLHLSNGLTIDYLA
jgi:hypothetical protein